MKLLFCSCLLAIVTIVNSYAQMNYRVEITFTDEFNTNGGVKDGDVVRLYYIDQDVTFKSVVKNGKASFEGSINEPTVAMFNYKTGGVKLLLDGSDYALHLNTIKEGNRYTYESVVKTNSVFHNLWDGFNADLKGKHQQKREMLDKIDKSKTEEEVQALRREISLLDLEIKNSFKTTALRNPDNHAVAYFMGDAPDFSYRNYIDIFRSLNPEVQQSRVGQRLFTKLEAVKSMSEPDELPASPSPDNLLGHKIPEILGVDAAGKNVRLTDFNSPYTLIEFWASWCGPCRVVNIDMRAKYAAYKKQGLEIIGFSLDTDAERWKKAVEKDNTGWLQISDLKAGHSPVAQYFNLDALPANVVVDRNGVIVAQNIYGEALDRLLSK